MRERPWRCADPVRQPRYPQPHLRRIISDDQEADVVNALVHELAGWRRAQLEALLVAVCRAAQHRQPNLTLLHVKAM